jgi:outer membrane protein TolC
MKYCKALVQIIVFIVITNVTVNAQEKVLHIEELFGIIKRYHPIMLQTDINIAKADMNLWDAKGNFDPVIAGNFSGKKLKEELYYQDLSTEVKVPLWYGMDIHVNMDALDGTRTDPSKTLGGSSLLGIQAPLLKGLIMDKRRASVLQAREMQKLSANEQSIIRNNLLLEAAYAYWTWVYSYEVWQIMKQNVATNELRFSFIKQSLQLGERAAIDTVEAYSQLINFQNLSLVYEQRFLQAGVELSVFLWKQDGVPYQLDPFIIPQSNWNLDAQALAQEFNLDLLMQRARMEHPEISIYNIKKTILEIDRKLKKQELLPKLDIKYNFLASSANPLQTISDMAPFTDNFSYGLKAELPLYFRKGKAEYQLANLKLKENALMQDYKVWQIHNKVRNYYVEYTQLTSQIKLQTENVKNYQALVRGEELKMENGESSLFMINARENKALEAIEKLIELKVKKCKAIYTILWSSGQMGS